MSSTPQVDSTDDRRPVTEEPAEAIGLTASIMNRTHWMQRALSPWVQRWLSTAEGTSERSGRLHPFISLTVAATQRTLDRLHVQYQSHSNLETWADNSSLPLAGTVEKQSSSPVSEPAVPVKPRRAQGPYSRPFESMEEFARAVEAAKERNYAPPPPEELQPQPAPKRERGKYSRAFSSFEDFVKAIEETGSQWGSVAEEASSSVEEVEPSLLAESPARMPARVHPISRIEELPAHIEAKSVSSPVDVPTPPEFSQPAPRPQPAPAAKPVTPQAQPKSALSAAPQAAAASTGPQLQRSPLEASSDSSMPEDEVEPLVQRSVTPTLQRMETPAQAEPEEVAASDNAEPAASPELDQVVQRLSQPTTSHVDRPVDMPLVQRQTATSETPEEIPSDEEEPSETEPPVMQRKAASLQRQADVSLATLSAEFEEPSAPTEEPLVQRQMASPVQPEPATGSFARPALPLVQRRIAEDETEPEEPEEQSAPVVQRQIAEVEAAPFPETPTARPSARQPQATAPQSPQTTVQRRSDVTVPPLGDHAPAPTADRASDRSTQLPLVVQRQSAMPESSQAIELPVEVPADLPVANRPSTAPLQAADQAGTGSVGIDMPLVQRQAAEAPEPTDEQDTTEETVQRSVDVSAPAPDKPLVQRQTAEAKKPTLPAAPIPEAAPVPQAIQPGEKKIVAPLADSKPPTAHVEMPLVQRQTAETELEPPDLGVTEAAPTAEAVSADEVVPREEIDTAETLQRKSTTAKTLRRKAASPVSKPATLRVQRHTAEPIEPMEEETPAGPSVQPDSRAPLEMPFVQRQPLESKSAATSSQPTAVQRNVAPDEPEAEVAAAQPAFDLSERVLSRVAPPERRTAIKPAELTLHHPAVQRESQPETTVSDQAVRTEHISAPFASLPTAVDAAPVIQRTAEPGIQRMTAEAETNSSGTGFIQRVESAPSAAEPEAKAAEEVDLDNLARQVYPLIKRMIAVERERRAFR